MACERFGALELADAKWKVPVSVGDGSPSQVDTDRHVRWHAMLETLLIRQGKSECPDPSQIRAKLDVFMAIWRYLLPEQGGEGTVLVHQFRHRLDLPV